MKNRLKRVNDPNLNHSKQEERDDMYARPAKAFREVINSLPDDAHNVLLFGTEQSRAESRQRIAAELCHKIDFYDTLPMKSGKKRGQGTLAARGTATKNPSAATLVDLKIDAMKCVWKVIQNPKHRMLFVLTYILDAGEEKLSKADQHVFSRYAQQIGRLFMKNKIWPVRSYLVSIREKRNPAQQSQQLEERKAA